MRRMMMAAIVATALVLILVVTMTAQQPTLSDVLDQIKAFVLDLQARQDSFTVLVGQRLDAHDVNFQSQTSRLNDLEARIAELERPSPPPPSPPSGDVVVSFASLSDGPLTGSYQGITFSSGHWRIVGGQLAPVADGQPQRSLTFPSSVLVKSVTYSVTAIKLSDNGGQTVSGPVVSGDTVLPVNWANRSLSFSVSNPAPTPAPNMRIRQVVYQP